MIFWSSITTNDQWSTIIPHLWSQANAPYFIRLISAIRLKFCGTFLFLFQTGQKKSAVRQAQSGPKFFSGTNGGFGMLQNIYPELGDSSQKSNDVSTIFISSLFILKKQLLSQVQRGEPTIGWIWLGLLFCRLPAAYFGFIRLPAEPSQANKPSEAKPSRAKPTGLWLAYEFSIFFSSTKRYRLNENIIFQDDVFPFIYLN